MFIILSNLSRNPILNVILIQPHVLGCSSRGLHSVPVSARLGAGQGKQEILLYLLLASTAIRELGAHGKAGA